jgi:hypothetical protein
VVSDETTTLLVNPHDAEVGEQREQDIPNCPVCRMHALREQMDRPAQRAWLTLFGEIALINTIYAAMAIINHKSSLFNVYDCLLSLQM